jgi:hypothetical protein
MDPKSLRHGSMGGDGPKKFASGSMGGDANFFMTRHRRPKIVCVRGVVKRGVTQTFLGPSMSSQQKSSLRQVRLSGPKKFASGVTGVTQTFFITRHRWTQEVCVRGDWGDANFFHHSRSKAENSLRQGERGDANFFITRHRWTQKVCVRGRGATQTFSSLDIDGPKKFASGGTGSRGGDANFFGPSMSSQQKRVKGVVKGRGDANCSTCKKTLYIFDCQ